MIRANRNVPADEMDLLAPPGTGLGESIVTGPPPPTADLNQSPEATTIVGAGNQVDQLGATQLVARPTARRWPSRSAACMV
jgi:hypothetical protein